MLSDAIRMWNPWWTGELLSDDLLGLERQQMGVMRDFLGLRHVKDVVGVRRCGKSTLLYQVIVELTSSGVSPRDVVLLNFDDNEIYDADFSSLLIECKKINPGMCCLFLDEVQEKAGWERWVRSLYDTKQFEQIFVSGSSSSLIRSEMSRVLTGRHVSTVLYPFSFKEYLQFQGWKSFDRDYLEFHRAEVLHFLEQYMTDGGFPETPGREELKITSILSSLFDDIVTRDVTARHGADHAIAEKIAHHVVSNISKSMSYRSVARACDISTDTVSKYIPYFEDCFLLYSLGRFSYKLKEQMRSGNKYYCVDQGLANRVGFKFSRDRGRLMENMVFIELMRRKGSGENLFYWRNREGREVDFIVQKEGRIEQLIQSCYNPTDADTRKREIRALSDAMEEFNLKEGYLITLDYEDSETIENRQITYIPLWKWLLNI